MGDGFENAAVGSGAATASLDHAPQLGPYEPQPSDLGLNLLQMVSSNLLSGVARKRGTLRKLQELANVLHVKAEITGVADEV